MEHLPRSYHKISTTCRFFYGIHGAAATLQVQRGRQSARPQRAGVRCGVPDVGGGRAFGTLAEARWRVGENIVKKHKKPIVLVVKKSQIILHFFLEFLGVGVLVGSFGNHHFGRVTERSERSSFSFWQFYVQTNVEIHERPIEKLWDTVFSIPRGGLAEFLPTALIWNLMNKWWIPLFQLILMEKSTKKSAQMYKTL